MPPKSSEPSNYSLDEMMDRLREGERDKNEPEESGELVTRPDGTKVMRVKRRKRRSEQAAPKKTKRKTPSKAIKLIIVGAVLVLLFLSLLGALIKLAKFNSEGFRVNLEESLSTSVGGTLSLNRLTVTPAKARAEKVQVNWPEDSFLQTASLRSLEAGVGLRGFLSSNWTGDQIRAKSGVLRLLDGDSKSYPAFSDTTPFRYEEFICEDMDAFLGDGENPPVKFEGVEFSIRGEEGSRQAILHGGVLELRGWGRMEIGNGVLRFENNGCVLSTMRLKPEGALRGDIVLKSEDVIIPGKDSTMDVSLSNVGLGHLLGEQLGELLDGIISSKRGKINISSAHFSESSLFLPVEGSGGELRGLPFLISLRTLLNDTEFAKPFFRDISAVIQRKGDEVMISDLVLSEKGFMEVRGSMSVNSEGALTGRLRVGIHENKAMNSTGRKRSLIFSDPVGGYAWVDLKLGGTVDIPEDNWNELLRNASREAANQREFQAQP